MILLQLSELVCSVCELHMAYGSVKERVFDEQYTHYTVFNDKPYYLCSPSCLNKFELTPVLYKPIPYRNLFMFNHLFPTLKEMEKAKQRGFTLESI